MRVCERYSVSFNMYISALGVAIEAHYRGLRSARVAEYGPLKRSPRNVLLTETAALVYNIVQASAHPKDDELLDFVRHTVATYELPLIDSHGAYLKVDKAVIEEHKEVLMRPPEEKLDPDVDKT